VKVKKISMDLYRAVDSQGNTLEFLLSPTRDARAAKRSFLKTLAAPHSTTPRVITVDKNAVYAQALDELQAAGTIPEGCELPICMFPASLNRWGRYCILYYTEKRSKTLAETLCQGR
jgi:transposase-like protein